MWLKEVIHLLKGSWLLMARTTGTNSLGILVWVFLLALLSWIIPVASRAYANKREGKPHPVSDAFNGSRTTGIQTFAAIGAVTLIVWVIATVIYIRQDHDRALHQNSVLESQNEKLRADLENRRHNVSTSDPVFPNLIYMLQAFRLYRAKIGNDTCVIRVTAPPESEPLASVFAQLSINTSNCSTFGPMFSSIDPDELVDAKNGMVSDAIVLHAPKDDSAALQLFDNLGNQIKVVRSYVPTRKMWADGPTGPAEHVIWLQFGDKVMWNSERVLKTNGQRVAGK